MDAYNNSSGTVGKLIYRVNLINKIKRKRK